MPLVFCLSQEELRPYVFVPCDDSALIKVLLLPLVFGPLCPFLFVSS